MQRKLGNAFAEYAAYHRTPGNRLCHFFGITMIVVSLFGLLGPRAGLVLWALGTARVAWLDLRVSFSFGLALLAAYLAGQGFSVVALWVLFVAGWVFQAVGHAVFEKKSPAFFKNLEHLLIGPVYVFCEACGLRPWSGSRGSTESHR